MTNRIAAGLVAIALLAAPVHLGGCGAAGVAAVVSTVIDVIDWVAGKVDAVEQHVDLATEGGYLPADVAQRVERLKALIAKARRAGEASPALIAELVAAWEDLLAVVAPFGVTAASLEQRERLGAGGPGQLLVPTGGEIDEALRSAKAAPR